ncbi:MAG: hypothetical protein QM802_19385 [Agriterribacter sp.]
MPANVKAIVLKTTKFKATRFLFENILKFQIKESSARHFVIHSKDVRLVFMKSFKHFKVEIYATEAYKHLSKQEDMSPPTYTIKNYEDPNGIAIMIARFEKK